MPVSSRGRRSGGYSPLPIWSWQPPSSALPNVRMSVPRRIFYFARIAIPIAIVLLIVALVTWEPHIELAFYKRAWVRAEIEAVQPLAGCFEPARVSPRYNVSERLYGPRTTEVHSGVPLRFGRDCYNLASTLQAPPLGRHYEEVVFHSYWRVDLASFGPRQEHFLKSFFATQDIERGARLILWSNGDLSTNAIIHQWLQKYPRAFEVRRADISVLARGTALEGSEFLRIRDTKAWVDGDLVRLLVVWAYGGVWVDMDSLLTRDLSPLLEHEFVTQWDCYDKPYNPFNGALMRFHQHSPYLCEAFHIMATSPPPRKGSTDWGALLYFKLWRRLVASHIPPFKVLPWCWADGRSCRLDNRIPDPFLSDTSSMNNGWWNMTEGGSLDKALRSVFVLHLHNQWEKAYPQGGWVERLLLRKYDHTLGTN